ncbi:hypothetical protein ASG97_09985 [Bacillus sp. Soil745]|uniref:hypothetical protein n=1 Tax=Peribacillus frigoritolerans TaxID=450367 RepID=UPI000709A448|nr:hypothetical protein [Peribacillus frigoritolerans]KRF52160.1 hypothetical protein ASG97_09985 [Bacillus sp. Soil745]MED3708797.1 hypothetical protein [Peribacillus frigoritolerans]PAW28121.1 hypothetical protein BKC07_15840 [Peribacillus simplex]CAH0196478.1 hypothetical protein SRABI80_01725 [Peribacillus frigoritolerans]
MIQRDQLEMFSFGAIEHLVRIIEVTIDISFIYDLVKDIYSEVVRPCIDPVILVKLTFIQSTLFIRLMHNY